MTSIKLSSIVKKGGALQHNLLLENVNTIVIIFLSLAVISLIIYYKSLENKKTLENTGSKDKIILVNDPFYYDKYYYDGYYDPYYTLYYPSWNDWKWWGSGYSSGSGSGYYPHHGGHRRISGGSYSGGRGGNHRVGGGHGGGGRGGGRGGHH